MSSETVVRQCERCDLTEGTVLCQECAGKEGITVELKRRDFKCTTVVVRANPSIPCPVVPPGAGPGPCFRARERLTLPFSFSLSTINE